MSDQSENNGILTTCKAKDKAEQSKCPSFKSGRGGYCYWYRSDRICQKAIGEYKK